MTIVLDEIGRGEADLYVDANRNRRIEAADRVDGENRTWRLPLDLAIVEGEITRYERRAAIFRLGATGITFSHAAAGYLEGKVEFAGRLARRPAHGRRRQRALHRPPAIASGSTWNDDGRWDSSSEQFLFASILWIGDVRYAVRSDPFGQRLSVEPLKGSGTVRLALANRQGLPAAVELSATLIGRDGSAVGTYRRAGSRRRFRSENTGWAPSPVPLKIAKGDRAGTSCSPTSAAEARPAGTRSSRTARPRSTRSASSNSRRATEGTGPARPGEDLKVQPQLFTGDGLLIVTCYRGMLASPAGDTGTGATIELAAADGRTLATAHSGFA